MKKTKLFFTAIFISLFFAGCFQPVYYEIRKDVEPTKATISGNIPEITRTTVEGKEFLVLNANGVIQYKQKDKSEHGQWQLYDNLPFEKLKYDSINSKFEGEQLIKVLSDSDTLFIVSAKYNRNEDFGTNTVDYLKVYAIKLSLNSEEKWNTDIEWKNIINDSDHKYFDFDFSDDYQYNNIAIFQTNSPMAKNRKVFVRSGNSKENVKYYELSGLNEPAELSDVNFADESEYLANSAVYFNGETLFFNSAASTTNETYENEATRFYFGKESKLWCNSQNNSSEEIEEILNAENVISCLATTKDSILIGRGNFGANTTYSGGIAKTFLDENGKPNNKLESFDTNASFQLPSSYFINSIVNATPEKSEKESYLYASTSFKGTGSSSGASFKNVGLWSYYPQRGNWNRE